MFVAQVDSFNSEKRYGFLLTPKGYVHFHMDNGRQIASGSRVAVFVKKTTVEREPIEGDWLAFNVRYNRRNQPFAAPWGFDHQRSEAERVLAQRSVPPRGSSSLNPDWE